MNNEDHNCCPLLSNTSTLELGKHQDFFLESSHEHSNKADIYTTTSMEHASQHRRKFEMLSWIIESKTANRTIDANIYIH